VFAQAQMGDHDRGYQVTGTVQVPTIRHHGEVESRQGGQISLNLRESAENVSDTVDLLYPLQLYDSV
jgi:hypothetical protein